MQTLCLSTRFLLTAILGWIISGPSVSPGVDPQATILQHTDMEPPFAQKASSLSVQPEYVADELLVTFKAGIPEARIKEINESLGVHVLRKMLSGRTYQVKIPVGKSLEDLRIAYLSFTEVESAEPNYKVEMKERDDVGEMRR